MSAKGTLMFAKYAYSPNKLGYCGPDDHRGIFDYCVANQSDKGLIKLLKNFEGAFPYLKLIAKANKIMDPFDEKVVEAYWIGSNLLNNISVQDFYDSIKNRFGMKINQKNMKWLLTKPPAGAKPHHSFHVLDVYTRTGLIRSGVKTNVLETINNCLIMWGRVIEIRNPCLAGRQAKFETRNNLAIKQFNNITINYYPVILKKGKLAFGGLVERKLLSPFECPKEDDWVSFHWGTVCEVLDSRKFNNLKKWTVYHLDLANKTM